MRVVGRSEAAAERLARLDTAHPAAELIVALAVRLARDVDEAPAVRDRILAAREVRDLVGELDAAMLPPARAPEPDADDDGVDPDGGDLSAADDPFNVGDVPPGVEYPPSP